MKFQGIVLFSLISHQISASCPNNSLAAQFLRSSSIQYVLPGRCPSADEPIHYENINQNNQHHVPSLLELVSQNDENSPNIMKPPINKSQLRGSLRRGMMMTKDTHHTLPRIKTLHMIILGGCLLFLVWLLDLADERRKYMIEKRQYEWRSHAHVLVQHDVHW